MTKFTESAEDPALVTQIRNYRSQHLPHSSQGGSQQFEFPRIVPTTPTNSDPPSRRKNSLDSPRKRNFSNNILPKIGKGHHASFSSVDRIVVAIGPSHHREAEDVFFEASNASRPHLPHNSSHPGPTSRARALDVQKSSHTSATPATDVRASQVIYRSGFLNHRAFAPSHDSANLAKGWNPRKVLL